jgi:hypothetical protein
VISILVAGSWKKGSQVRRWNYSDMMGRLPDLLTTRAVARLMMATSRI